MTVSLNTPAWQLELVQYRAQGSPLFQGALDGILTLAKILDATEYMAAVAYRARLMRRWLEFLEDWPVILAPVSVQPTPAFDADLVSTEAVRRIFGNDLRFNMAVSALGVPVVTTPKFDTKIRPFVKKWSVDELVPALEKGLTGRNFDKGRNLFGEAKCFACHRFVSEGGGLGPDLTAVSGRFNPRDMLEALLEPSKQISDQYQALLISTTDGPSRTVIDGPFAETRELVAGFWLWQVKDMAEAVAWVKRCPNPMPGPSEIEIRPVYEMADFAETLTPEVAEQEDRLRDRIARR